MKKTLRKLYLKTQNNALKVYRYTCIHKIRYDSNMGVLEGL